MSTMGPYLGQQTTSAGITDPASWASAQLSFMGLPTTDANVQFLVSWAAAEGGNWNNTAHYNPLNTTLKESGSTSMNSVGVQSFTSWQQGLQATASTLAGYPQIMAALKSGNAMTANQSGALAQDFLKWSGGGYSQIGGNSNYGSFQGGTQMTAGTGGDSATSTTAPNLSMNDIPGLVAYITNQLGPAYAWMLNVPELSTALEDAVVKHPGDRAQIMAAIEATNWWKTTSVAMRTYLQQKNENPAEYSFTTPGSAASGVLAQVKASAAQYGVSLTQAQAETLATNYMINQWNSAQLQQAIGMLAKTNQAGVGNAQPVAEQIKQMANEYYMSLTPAALQSWVTRIATGTQTMAQFQAQMSQNAALKWTGFAQQLRDGYTMQQLTDNYRTEAAKVMEVDPNSIDFTNNPFYSKILDYVPPNSPDGVHRVMTLSEMDQHLKGDPNSTWKFTQNARDTAAGLEQTILQAFGKTGQ